MQGTIGWLLSDPGLEDTCIPGNKVMEYWMDSAGMFTFFQFWDSMERIIRYEITDSIVVRTVRSDPRNLTAVRTNLASTVIPIQAINGLIR